MTEETPEYGQDEMAHDLPRAEIVDRIEWLAAQCTGKRVMHVGFADAGFRLEHPDHVVMFTWRTLTELMRRSGWDHTQTVTYVPAIRERGNRSRLEAAPRRQTTRAGDICS